MVSEELKHELRAVNLIVSYQLALGIMPYDKKLSEFIYHCLKQLDEISFCRVCLFFAEESLGDQTDEYKNKLSCSIFHKKNKTNINNCVYFNNNDYLLISVQSIHQIYGYIIINNSPQLSKTLRTAINNLANTLTLYIEHHIQKEKLQAQNEKLRKAKEKAEESDRLKTAFLENMSHEIRTPMNAIQGFAEILQTPGLPLDQIKEFADLIAENANQLIFIVNDILTLSSLDAGMENLKLKTHSPKDIVNEIFQQYQAEALNKKLILQLDVSQNGNYERILMDKVKVKKILSYLVANSLKFTHKGSISIGLQLKNEVLEFSIKDTGIGIDSKYHEKIFERFWQLETGWSRNYEGNGLGLPISRGLAELMGGKIRVDSEPGKGSNFYFNLSPL